MNKLAYLLLLFTGLFSSGIIQAQWEKEESPTKNNLNGVFLKSSHSGWIVGDKGTILKKSNNGWIEYQKPTSENLYSIFMVSENDGWSVGAAGTIIHFNGKSWEKYDSPTDKNLFSVSFKDSQNGIAVGEYGTIIFYENKKWSLLEGKIRGDLFAADYINDEVWFGGGLECENVPIMRILLNQDKKTIITSSDSYATICSISFLNADDGWAVGSPCVVLHYDGQRWEKVKVNDSFSSLTSVFFSDENNGISVGYGGTILAFLNNKWIKENSNNTLKLNDVTIYENTFYAVGDNGTILIKNQASNYNLGRIRPQPSKIKLFPNPCDGFLNIIFSEGESNSIGLISITDSFGRIIIQKTINLENENSAFQLKTSELENGFYILKTIINKEMTINKFVISH